MSLNPELRANCRSGPELKTRDHLWPFPPCSGSDIIHPKNLPSSASETPTP